MTGDGTIRGMLALCTAILVAAALYLGRSIFAPVAFSLFALAIVWPFQGALQAKIPKLVALVFTLLLTLIVFAMLGLAIAWGSGQVGHWLLSNVDPFSVCLSLPIAAVVAFTTSSTKRARFSIEPP